MKHTLAFVTGLALLTSLAAGCGAGTETTATPTYTPADPVAAGQALFSSKGCASCHGRDAEGGYGPALAGHTREQIVKQVRNPVGAMPTFDVNEVSDEELDQIVAFILSLKGDGDGHMMDDGMMH